MIGRRTKTKGSHYPLVALDHIAQLRTHQWPVAQGVLSANEPVPNPMGRIGLIADQPQTQATHPLPRSAQPRQRRQSLPIIVEAAWLAAFDPPAARR